jgi:hypothetical protein
VQATIVFYGFSLYCLGADVQCKEYCLFSAILCENFRVLCDTCYANSKLLRQRVSLLWLASTIEKDHKQRTRGHHLKPRVLCLFMYHIIVWFPGQRDSLAKKGLAALELTAASPLPMYVSLLLYGFQGRETRWRRKLSGKSLCALRAALPQWFP